MIGRSISTNNDCNGVASGLAYLDECGDCVEGNTGLKPCSLNEEYIWTKPSNALPVELIQFDGELIENRTRLNWSTASEENVAGFEIQKSNNATDWERLHFVSANNQPSLYQEWDKNPFEGITYYRLRIIDLDISFEYSNIISVYRGNVADILVFPNPTSESINVSFKSKANTDVKVEVVDVLGRTVFSQNVFSTIEKNHSINIDLQHLPSGSYLLSLQDGSQVKTIPFVLKND